MQAARIYGTQYISLAQVPYTNIITAGDYAITYERLNRDYPGIKDVFIKTQMPELTNVDYLFVDFSGFLSNAVPPNPLQTDFTPTNTTRLILGSVGRPMLLAAWSKQSILNGFTNKFAYLGQYFDKAFKADSNGNATTNETGILSEYGEFFPTEPGPVLLTTKPDPSQGGIQGSCLVHIIALQVDVNHDGNMDCRFGGSDSTSADRPFVFWINNDFDRDHAIDTILGMGDDREEDDLASNDHDAGCPIDPSPTPDCDYKLGLYGYGIPSKRDLEDYARIWIPGLAALHAAHTNLNFELSVRTINQSDGPAINLVLAVEDNGGTNYLFDTNVANAQISEPSAKCIGRIAANGTTATLNNFFDQVNDSKDYFIFCGARRGMGELVLTVKSGSVVLA